MLQQTTVSTVKGKFDGFLAEFPTVKALAHSTEDDVTKAWKGLGYYRRARNLRLACIYIHEELGGEIPLVYEELIKIPGVGEYTANAILSIGADLRALAIDANIERVLARIYGYKEEKGPKLQKALRKDFESKKLLPMMDRVGARKLNEALMDLGRVYCQAKKVDCLICPVAKNCKSLSAPIDPLSIPKIKDKPKKSGPIELKLLRVVVRHRGKVIGYRKTSGEWLEGQVELPTFVIECSDKSLKQYPRLNKKMEVSELPSVKTTITKYKITNYILELKRSELDALVSDKSIFSYFPVNNDSNLSTATLKCCKKLAILDN
jgi:A/G-specific adenine glycosylase